ncbi:MAG: helix-turn-helix domain-containing protein [Planctomycetaceae bacterium]|nr:helix-turn-helix domain-containing protein [Planctomycetaceae bacterium]
MPEFMTEILHTIEKVAKILNVSKGTVRNLIRRRELVPVRFSNRIVRIPQSEIDNYIRVARDDSRKH